MPTAAALLDRIGRPGDLSLGTARPEPLGRLPTGLAVLDEALGGGLPRGRIGELAGAPSTGRTGDRESTRLNSSHRTISYAGFCLKKKILAPAVGDGQGQYHSAVGGGGILGLTER